MMRIGIRHGKDFFSGLILVSFGGITVLESLRYEMGSAARMQAGYFPCILGGILSLLGLTLVFRSFVIRGEPVKALAYRPLIMVTASVIAFAFLLESWGLIIATMALVFLCSLGRREFRLGEVFLLYICLIVLSTGLFVFGLGVTLKITP